MLRVPGLGKRDVMVTGMGFCLPGGSKVTCTADELWSVASAGRSCLVSDGIYYSTVKLAEEQFAEFVPGIPGAFAKHFTAAHQFGLVSFAAAADDAGLDYQAGDLAQAAILAGRGSIDANVSSYLAALEADPDATAPADALELYIRTEQAASPSDVALVQAALARSTGPCFTVSCGCASSAVQVGNAAALISGGGADIAVVTGVDVFNAGLVRKAQRLLRAAQHAAYAAGGEQAARLLPSFDRPMRPYDRRAECVNFGEGAAALILESREHAARRGARCYGRVLAHAMTRDGLSNPLSSDESGAGLAAAIQQCLGGRWALEQVPYIHGGSDGDTTVTAFESNAVRQVYGAAGITPLMSSQEACFGHNGAPAGSLGVALTLLMIRNGQVCPTANCEQPADGLSFDPVPGTAARPLSFSYALNLTYQIGGVKNAILVGAPDVT